MDLAEVFSGGSAAVSDPATILELDLSAQGVEAAVLQEFPVDKILGPPFGRALRRDNKRALRGEE